MDLIQFATGQFTRRSKSALNFSKLVNLVFFITRQTNGRPS